MGNGSYNDETRECHPSPQSHLWIPVVFLQFLIVIAGCVSHSIFIQLVVIPRKFGRYLRIAFGLISLMMLNMLLTSTGAFVLALVHGKYIEDCEISAIVFRKWLLYVHSFGEYFFVVCELLGTIERLISLFYSKFRKTDAFIVLMLAGGAFGVSASIAYIYFIRISFSKFLFGVGFGSLTAMETINAIIVFWLLYKAKRMYKTDKSADLNTKFETSQSFTYSRCAAASVIARVLIITFVYCQVFGLFGGAWADSGFYYVMNVLINFYCLVYPWAIMLSHRKIKEEVYHRLNLTFLGHGKKRIHVEGLGKKLYTIDGKHMNQVPGKDDHFIQLHTFWNLSSNSSTVRQT